MVSKGPWTRGVMREELHSKLCHFIRLAPLNSRHAWTAWPPGDRKMVGGWT